MDKDAISRALEAQERLDKLQAMCDELLVALKAHTQRDAQVAALVEVLEQALEFAPHGSKYTGPFHLEGDSGQIRSKALAAIKAVKQE